MTETAKRGSYPLDKDAEIEQLRAALRGLVEAVGNMRVPQNVEDVALQVTVTLGPAFETARRVLKTEPA